MKLKIYGLDFDNSEAATTRVVQSEYAEIYGAWLEENADGLPVVQIMPRLAANGLTFTKDTGIWELGLKIGSGLAYDGSGNLYTTNTGLDVHQSVRAATTANIATLAGGAPDTLDGVTLAANDRILVKNQSTGSQNGIYYVSTLGTGSNGTWTRATDADATGEISEGTFVFVTEGTTQANTGWTVTTTGTITINTTAIVFEQFSGAEQITAGAGLTKSGTTLDIVGTSNRITVNADSIDIASTYVGQSSITTLGTITTGVWQGTGIANAYLANSSITLGATSVALGATAASLSGLTSVSATTLTGTLSTAAQTNITSVGTLNALTMGGILTLVAGTTAVPPLRFLDGTNLSAAVSGAMEWDGTNLFITQTSGPTRKTLAYTDSNITGSAASLTTSRTIWGQSFNGTANVSGALSGATTGAFSSNVTVGGSLTVTGTLLANARPNVYVADTTILNLRNSAATADAREWSFRIDAGGALALHAVSDANVNQLTAVAISRAGGVTFAGALGGITTITTSGAINSQTISAAANFTGTVTAATALIVGTTVAAAGNVRLPNNTSVAWRNSTNSGDVTFKVNASNRFEASVPLTVSSGGTGLDSTAYTGITATRVMLYDGSTGNFTPLSGGISGQFLKSTGASGDVMWDTPPVFTSSTNGYVPLSGGGTTNFLRADGTWAAPTISSISASNVTAGTFPGAVYTFSDQVNAVEFVGALTGTASSATTLATSRTLWGQSFNGSANVTGSLTGVTSIAASSTITTTGTGGFSVNTTLGTVGVQWQDSGVNRVIMRLDSSSQWSIQSRDGAGAGIDTLMLFNMAAHGDLRLGGTGRSVIINQSGTAFSTVAGLYVRGEYNPSSGTARIVRLDGTLTATANSDTLIAMDIAGIYTPGAFSSVAAYGIRVAGVTAATSANYALYLSSVSGATTNYAIFTNDGLVRFGGAVTTTSTITATGQITATAGIRAGIGFAVQTTPVTNALFYVASSGLITGSTSGYNAYLTGTHQSDVTSNMYGVFTQLRSAAAVFTTTSGFGMYVANPSLGAGHTLTTNYGLYIGGQTAGGTNYAIYTNEGLVRFGGAVTATSGLTVSAGSLVSNVFTDVNGYSTSYGSTASITTTGLRVRMGTSASATWLVAGTSAGTFRGGVQVLDAGGVMRLYVGSNYLNLGTGTGTTMNLSNVGDLTVEGSALLGDGTRAAAGIVRLANTRTIAWRNSTNSGDVTLTVNSSNRFETSTPFTVGSGGTGLDASAYSGISGQRFVVYDDSGTFTVVSAGIAGQALVSGGPTGDLTWDNPTPASHSITSHTASGLTTGHVLQATSATTYAFQALTVSAASVTAGTFPGALYTFSDSLTAVGTVTADDFAGATMVLTGTATIGGAVTINEANAALLLNDNVSGSDAATSVYISLRRAGVEKGWLGFGDGSGSIMRLWSTIGEVRVGTEAAATTTLYTNNTARLTVGSAGGVGVGITPSTTAGRLDAANDVVAFSSSDVRFKKNLRKFHGVLDQLAGLFAGEFEWRAETEEHHGYSGNDMGLLAQEVEQVFPTAVRTREDGYKGLRYERMIAPLVAAIQDLYQMVKELQV